MVSGNAKGVQCMTESFLFCLYLAVGLTSWLLTNSLFIQVPNFANVLPEGYEIASMMSVVIQISNLFALIYVACYKYAHLKDWIWVTIIQLLAIATAFGIAFGWDVVWGNYSVVLLFLAALSGFVGCMSVVVFYPFAAKSSPFLTSAISLGMGLTGLVSSILGILQTLLGFSVEAYFVMNAVILIFSFMSFGVVMLYNHWQRKNSVPATLIDDSLTLESESPEEETINSDTPPLYNAIEPLSKESHMLCGVQCVNCFIYYLLLGVIPYSVNQFENDSELLSIMYIWGMVLGSVGRFLCTFATFRTSSKPFMIICVTTQYILGIYILLQCFFTFVSSTWIWTIILSYIIVNAVNGYEDTLLYQVAAIIQHDSRNIERITRYIGLSNQAGAFCGSILSFILIELGAFG